jgi:peptidoglycan/LPS O-acetylase OafA/YrhL
MTEPALPAPTPLHRDGTSARTGNNIGLLRLLLASFVIIGHAPEQIDGNRARDPLAQIYPNLSLGHVSVLLFFLLSGFLITESFERSRTLKDYLLRRIVRIVPAFAVAYAVCIFIVAPMTGGGHMDWARAAINLVTLHAPPEVPGALHGLAYPALNGSMWTISHEFRCYLMVALIGSLGVFRNKAALLILTGGLLLLAGIGQLDPVRLAEARLDRLGHMEFWLGSLNTTLDLTAAFLVGAGFFVFRGTLLQDRGPGFVLALLAACLAAMLVPALSDIAVVTLGGVCVFWLAFTADLGPLQTVNDRWDISYGVYLYGWPIASVLLWHHRDVTPFELAVEALLASLAVGAASWFLVEKPVKEAVMTLWATYSARRAPSASAAS